MLHVLCCTRLRPGHLSVRVGDSSQGSEEIVKSLDLRLSMRLLSLLILLYYYYCCCCYYWLLNVPARSRCISVTDPLRLTFGWVFFFFFFFYHFETETPDLTSPLTQSQYTDVTPHLLSPSHSILSSLHISSHPVTVY